MTVRVERDGAVASVLLDRPRKLNAIDREMRAGVRAAFDELGDDDTVKVVVLTGTGDRAFSAGADLDEVGGRTAFERRRNTGDDVANVVRSCQKPVIAMIRGYALGGGLELACACDIRVASDTAVLGFPEIRHGWLPAGGGGTQALPRLVGMGQAMIAVLTGRHITAQRANQIGLVDEVVQNTELETATRALAEEIAVHRHDALVLAKAALRITEQTGLGAGMAYERELMTLCYHFDGRDEAIAAFREKRDSQPTD